MCLKVKARNIDLKFYFLCNKNAFRSKQPDYDDDCKENIICCIIFFRLLKYNIKEAV